MGWVIRLKILPVPSCDIGWFGDIPLPSSGTQNLHFPPREASRSSHELEHLDLALSYFFPSK